MTALATNMLTAFWVLSISLVLVPGADWAYAISAGMRDRAIAPAIGGMLLGYLTITAVVAAGVGARRECPSDPHGADCPWGGLSAMAWR